MTAARGLLAESRRTFCCSAWIAQLWCMGSVAVAHRLSWTTARGILVPGLGVEPSSSSFQGRFLTAGPPGKSQDPNNLCKRRWWWKVSSQGVCRGKDSYFWPLLFPHHAEEASGCNSRSWEWLQMEPERGDEHQILGLSEVLSPFKLTEFPLQRWRHWTSLRWETGPESLCFKNDTTLIIGWSLFNLPSSILMKI